MLLHSLLILFEILLKLTASFLLLLLFLATKAKNFENCEFLCQHLWKLLSLWEFLKNASNYHLSYWSVFMLALLCVNVHIKIPYSFVNLRFDRSCLINLKTDRQSGKLTNAGDVNLHAFGPHRNQTDRVDPSHPIPIPFPYHNHIHTQFQPNAKWEQTSSRADSKNKNHCQ